MLNCCLIIWYVIFVLSLVHKEISNDLIITCKLCYLFICQPRYLKYISFSVINILIQIIRNFNQRLKILWCCPFSVCTIIQHHRYYRHYCFLIILSSVWSTFISWYSCRHSFLNLCLILYAIHEIIFNIQLIYIFVNTVIAVYYTLYYLIPIGSRIIAWLIGHIQAEPLFSLHFFSQSTYR